MALSRDHLFSAGFVIGDTKTDTGLWMRGPVGTCFNVILDTDTPGEYHAFVVTAAHVVQGQNRIEVRFRGDRGIGHWPVDHWIFPEDPHLDVAVAPLDPPSDQDFAYHAIPVSTLAADVLNVAPKLGGNVFYIGLLSAVEQMKVDVVPVARRGSVAALDQPGVEWDGHWTADKVHLVDVRSIGGHSGSPCIMQASYPGPRLGPLPPAWEALAQREGVDADQIGFPHLFAALWGMFVAHIETRRKVQGEVVRQSTGIGIVLPMPAIRRLLDGDEVRQIMEDKTTIHRGRAGRILSQAADQPTGALGPDDFLTDLRAVTRPLDEERSD